MVFSIKHLLFAVFLTSCSTSDHVELPKLIEKKKDDYKIYSVDMSTAVPETNAQIYLRLHNEVRFEKNLPPLTWSSKLEKSARQYARELALKNPFQLAHKKGNPYGENLAASFGGNYEKGWFINRWASEEKWYDYLTNTCEAGRQCGHYTQIVWRSTASVGCWDAPIKNSKYNNSRVYVCHYDPPGNYIGRKPY